MAEAEFQRLTLLQDSIETPNEDTAPGSARNPNFNKAELAFLVERIEYYKDVLNGASKRSSLFAEDMTADDAYKNIANEMAQENISPLVNGKRFVRSWVHIKSKKTKWFSKLKSRASNVSKERAQTGGGRVDDPFSDLEKKVIDLTGTECYSGVTGSVSCRTGREVQTVDLGTKKSETSQATTSRSSATPERGTATSSQPQAPEDDGDEPALKKLKKESNQEHSLRLQGEELLEIRQLRLEVQELKGVVCEMKAAILDLVSELKSTRGPVPKTQTSGGYVFVDEGGNLLGSLPVEQ